MKNLSKLLFIVTLLLLPFSYIYAQADVIETAREEDLLKYLLLDIPEQTDNPNFTIIFTDPSGKGVYITVDSGNERRIENPYILPALAIGDHKLTFKFTDSEEAEQIIERTLIVVPRAPVVKPPDTQSAETITVTGTALPNSTVKVHMSGATNTYKAVTTTNTEGTWEYTYKEDFKDGIYTITAITQKDGYGSDFAEEIVFTIIKMKFNLHYKHF